VLEAACAERGARETFNDGRNGQEPGLHRVCSGKPSSMSRGRKHLEPARGLPRGSQQAVTVITECW
jgi:hypothetical protein